jgi:hypothetical protein
VFEKYSNVSSITPKIAYDYVYKVQTMDGRFHQFTKGIRTNYEIVFFNSNIDEFDNLLNSLKETQTVGLKVPLTTDTFDYAEFNVNIVSYIPKGKTLNQKFYNTGLTVFFERVDYDDAI